jgi:bifunctional non-homologous end joining protein LigD
MKATTARLPVGAGWVYELRWDGMRAVVEVGIGDLPVRIWSANGLEATVAYPELTSLAGAFSGLAVVLDGEIVALDAAGIPSFERLQHRIHVSSTVDATDVGRSRAVSPPSPVGAGRRTVGSEAAWSATTAMSSA